ncbi:MAG: AbrB/MazE/SpoVT family DNA-binding domain-containing protein [Clostridia bacterium]|nr:AbrB/MazE/SpoVT family DNA-binding domain-containing protein [Clostridia bacterium]
MKSTGIIRKLDELGRVVIPIELRNKFNISEKDPMEIYVDGSNIILKKYESNCIFCGKSDNLKEFKEKQICSNCLSKLNSLSEKNKKSKK